jgi:hypothetical protein
MKVSMMRYLPIRSTALLLASSVTGGAQSSVKQDGSNVPIGVAAKVDGPVIKVLKILEDSRCPINARCIRAGDVRLSTLWLKSNGTKVPFELSLSKPAPLADGMITLEDVQPERMAGGPEVKPRDYRFTFKFEGGL